MASSQWPRKTFDVIVFKSFTPGIFATVVVLDHIVAKLLHWKETIVSGRLKTLFPVRILWMKVSALTGILDWKLPIHVTVLSETVAYHDRKVLHSDR